MPFYINPYNRPVTIDLGNPSRRTITLQPFAKAPAAGEVRVVEMTEKKAAFFLQINSIRACDISKVKAADISVAEIEADATAANVARMPARSQMTGDEGRDRSKAAADAFRAKEARELAGVARQKTVNEQQAAAREAGQERRQGIQTQRGGIRETGGIREIPEDPLGNRQTKPLVPKVAQAIIDIVQSKGGARMIEPAAPAPKTLEDIASDEVHEDAQPGARRAIGPQSDVAPAPASQKPIGPPAVPKPAPAQSAPSAPPAPAAPAATAAAT